MITIENSEAPLTDATLASVEERLGIKLPTEYREFLLKHNGGQPSPDCFTFQSPRKAYADSMVDWFLAVYDGEYDNFENYFRTYKIDQNRLPLSLVPIGHDPGGNLICISTSGDDCGKVYFWDHEREAPKGKEPTYENVHLIANSFNEFLDNLNSKP